MKFEVLKDKKRGVILSTDIAGDCDDVEDIKSPVELYSIILSTRELDRRLLL